MPAIKAAVGAPFAPQAPPPLLLCVALLASWFAEELAPSLAVGLLLIWALLALVVPLEGEKAVEAFCWRADPLLLR